MIDNRTLRHFGLTNGKGRYRSSLTDMYEGEIAAAVQDNQLLAVVGEYGSGKTTLVNDTVKRLAADPARSIEVIHVVDPDREKLRISNVLNAAIYHFGENPRREREARALQFVRLVGSAHVKGKQRVSIVIENAHRLHLNTIMALKDIREAPFMGVAPLFSVVLVGQGGLAEKLKSKGEIFYRTNVLSLDEEDGWMTHAERVTYLESVYGPAIETATRERIALMDRTPLALDHRVEATMREGLRAGYDVIDERSFPLTLRELKDLVGASVREIESASGVPSSTVQDALRDGDQHPKAAEVRRALQDLQRSHLKAA